MLKFDVAVQICNPSIIIYTYSPALSHASTLDPGLTPDSAVSKAMYAAQLFTDIRAAGT